MYSRHQIIFWKHHRNTLGKWDIFASMIYKMRNDFYAGYEGWVMNVFVIVLKGKEIDMISPHLKEGDHNETV